MKLVSFSLQNYRSIISARKVPLSDLSVLIGKNNEGKSNILHAIDLAMHILIFSSRYPVDRYGINILTHPGIRNKFSWDTDFPVQLKTKKRTTKFTLEFLLNDTEISRFKEEIKSSLNGELPIEISISDAEGISIKVIKKGPGAISLSKKSRSIARFIGNSISFNYIPAIRTAQSSFRVVNEMVSERLSSIEDKPEYAEAIKKIEEIQRPVLDEISHYIYSALAKFLPDIKNVNIKMGSDDIRSVLRRNFEIHIDDGVETKLELKGDGVKSIVALGLLKERKGESGESIIAFEEPESHLHPGAIHQLKNVISELATKGQIILSTHCGCFANRDVISSNIIIDNNKARNAKNISEIRDSLGIKMSDNLTNADFVLIVEGPDDKIALESILRKHSEKIRNMIINGNMVIDIIGGAGNLSYKASLHDAHLCKVAVFIDNDKSANDAYNSAIVSGIVNPSNTFFASVQGMEESELEDCYLLDVYKDEIEKFGVVLNNRLFKNNKKKWSDRMKDVFRAHGKRWDENTKTEIKHTVANLAAAYPANPIDDRKTECINGLVVYIENFMK